MVGECMGLGSCSVGRLRRRSIASVKGWLKKRDLDMGKAKTKLHDRNEWQGNPKEWRKVGVSVGLWGKMESRKEWMQVTVEEDVPDSQSCVGNFG